MSSFQRFQRDSRIRNYRNSSQKSSKLNNSHKKRIVNNVNTNSFLQPQTQLQPLNLVIYPKQIAFTIIPGAAQSMPYAISLTNESMHRLHFKIRTLNSSESYKISPFQDAIQIGNTINVSFTLTPGNTPLERFYQDRFQIQWGMIPERHNQKIELLYYQILTVKINNNRYQENRFTLGKQIQRTNTQSKLKKRYSSFPQNNNFNGVSQKLFQGFRSETEKDVQYQNRNNRNLNPLKSNLYQNRNQYAGELNEQQQEQMYKEWVNSNKKNIHQQQKKLQAKLIQMAIRGTIGINQSPLNSGFKNEEVLNRKKKYQSLLTKANIIIVAVVFFLIGLISA